MASYTRLGSYLLANELTADPSGKIHRGLTLMGSGFERHLLIRTFSDELMDAGLGSKLADAQRVAGLLAGTRGFGVNYQIETGKSAHVSCDYVPGRSLAQMLQKTREEQIPLGVDHALSVLQGMAQSLIQLHGKGIHHGTLSPHSIWVSFEGGTQILDAPFGALLLPLLPKAHALETALAPYRPIGAATALQQDLFALGAVLFELLTLEKLPVGEAIPDALAKATLKAAQEEIRLPAEIQALLARLLMFAQPFSDVSSFNQDLERVLYDGEYSPTTFNMAFFMHTLFREENDLDTQAMKGDQGADFTPFLPSDAGTRSLLENSDGSSRVKYLVMGGAALAVLFSGLLYSNHLNSKKNQDLQAKIAELQQMNAMNDGKLMDLTKQEDAQKVLQDQLSRKATEGKTPEERAKAKKDLEEAKKKSDDLARQREEALKKKQELSTMTQTIAQAAPAPAPKPEAKVETPKPEPPRQAAQAPPQIAVPPPVAAPAPQPQAAAPTPAPTPAPAATATDVVETPVAITKKVAPAPPRLANKNFLPPGLREGDIKVALKVFVDAQGRPLKVVITRGVDGPFGYNDSAQNAALASAYAPATKNGKPTTGWMNMEYNFGRAR